jgi:hypothetical protein
MIKHFDLGNIVVIALTIILFTVALFTKGFTHDLLLEVGVLLVSIKLIMMSYKNSVSNRELLNKLTEIREAITKSQNSL